VSDPAYEISVVVPSRNRCDLLAACLRALMAQTHPSFEIVVVDDASTDASVETVRREAPGARLVELDTNAGFAAAANTGARAATGRYVAFLNSDAEPEPTWLEALAAGLERHTRAASVEPKTLRYEPPDAVDGAGLSMTWSLKAYRRGAGERDARRYETEEEVFASSATASLWRADAFRTLGGFDESFFAYYEDVDLGFRARRLGYEAWYVPSAVVRHWGAGSSGGDESWKVRRSVTNRWATVVKNAPGSWLRRRAPTILAGELMWIAGSLARGHLRAHLRAYRRVLRSLPSWLEARRRVLPSRAQASDLSRLVHSRFPPLPPRSPGVAATGSRGPARRA
jgi:GT2 family glycosyltransferase